MNSCSNFWQDAYGIAASLLEFNHSPLLVQLARSKVRKGSSFSLKGIEGVIITTHFNCGLSTYIAMYIRKYFKHRYDVLGQDKIDLNNYTIVQLSNRIQQDGYSLQVWYLLFEGKVAIKSFTFHIIYKIIMYVRWQNSLLGLIA